MLNFKFIRIFAVLIVSICLFFVLFIHCNETEPVIHGVQVKPQNINVPDLFAINDGTEDFTVIVLYNDQAGGKTLNAGVYTEDQFYQAPAYSASGGAITLPQTGSNVGIFEFSGITEDTIYASVFMDSDADGLAATPGEFYEFYSNLSTSDMTIGGTTSAPTASGGTPISLANRPVTVDMILDKQYGETTAAADNEFVVNVAYSGLDDTHWIFVNVYYTAKTSPYDFQKKVQCTGELGIASVVFKIPDDIPAECTEVYVSARSSTMEAASTPSTDGFREYHPNLTYSEAEANPAAMQAVPCPGSVDILLNHYYD